MGFVRHIGRKTIKKRMLKQLQAVKMELCKRMHDAIAKTGAWLKQMLKGHLNYYAVSGNSPSLWWYFNEVQQRTQYVPLYRGTTRRDSSPIKSRPPSISPPQKKRA